MKNSHNSYERREGILDQLIYHLVRSIEYDCYPGAFPGQFRVFHTAGYFQSYSSFRTLEDGVKLLLEFNQNFPRHWPVSIFVDLKTGFSSSHSAEDFDAAIEKLPLFTPADLAGNESSLEAAIQANGWPEIVDMRGKFLWVITTGQESYCSDDTSCNARKAFVSTIAEAEGDVGKLSYSVFYNQNSKYSEFAREIFDRGFIGRVYDLNDIDDQEKWDKAIEGPFHLIATDKVNFHKDTFSKTHNADGLPFYSLNGFDVSTLDADEGASIMHMYANNGDTWGRVDDTHLAYFRVSDPTNEWVEYTTTISLVNSHCDEFAKAGIMVREESSDDRFPVGTGQYFAVVRTCEAQLRVQYRELAFLFTVGKRLQTRGGNVTDGIEAAKRTGLKLRYRYDGQNSYAEGYYKFEGTDDYLLIDQQVFPGVKMTIHGIFASSHYWGGNDDGTDYKALFINTKRNGELLTAANFTRVYKGDDENQAFGDGYFSATDESITGRRRVAHANLRAGGE
jgi:hypothetical protein